MAKIFENWAIIARVFFGRCLMNFLRWPNYAKRQQSEQSWTVVLVEISECDKFFQWSVFKKAPGGCGYLATMVKCGYTHALISNLGEVPSPSLYYSM
jgi:hypothetical protein